MNPCIAERSSLVLFAALAMALALGLLSAGPVMIDVGTSANPPLTRLAASALLAASAWRWTRSANQPHDAPAHAITALLMLMGLWGIAAGSSAAAIASRHALTAGVAVLFVFSQLCASNLSLRWRRVASITVVAGAVMVAAVAQSAVVLDARLDLRLVIWLQALPLLLWPAQGSASGARWRPRSVLPMALIWALVLVASHAGALAGVEMPAVLSNAAAFQATGLALLAAWAAWNPHHEDVAPLDAVPSVSVGELDGPSRRSTSLITSG